MATSTSKSARKSGAKKSASAKRSTSKAESTTTPRAGQTTERPAAGAAHPTGNLSVADHSEHPETPGDSTARHDEGTAERVRAQGAAGFPQGEYDVTNPAPAPGVPVEDDMTALLDAHLSNADTDRLKELLADGVLDDAELSLVIAAMPVGFVLEHEAENRWRCHITGQNRFGHGQTHQEAVEDYVLGTNAVTGEAAAARSFARLSAADQQAIRDRDAQAAEAVGAPATVPSRERARDAAAKRSGARGRTRTTSKGRK
jgi:hypothetical protein